MEGRAVSEERGGVRRNCGVWRVRVRTRRDTRQSHHESEHESGVVSLGCLSDVFVFDCFATREV